MKGKKEGNGAQGEKRSGVEKKKREREKNRAR